MACLGICLTLAFSQAAFAAIARTPPNCWPNGGLYTILAVPAINLTDDELAAVTAALRRLIDEDRFPHAPRLDPLRAALGKLEAAREPEPPLKAPPAKSTSGRAGSHSLQLQREGRETSTLCAR